MNTLLV
ncbi:hypothetical protein LINPERHAP1_LOCUS26618 [Linum perenne]